MKQRAKAEQDKINALKVARAAIRLRHMIEADTECNDILPLLNDRIDELQNQGKGWLMLTSGGGTPTVVASDDV